MLIFIGISDKRGWGRGVEGHAKDMLVAAGQDVTLVLCGLCTISSELGVLEFSDPEISTAVKMPKGDGW